jgi:hypothetical protein
MATEERSQRIFNLVRINLVELIIGVGFIAILFLIAAVNVYMVEMELVSDLRNSISITLEQVGTFFDTPLVTNAVTLFFWGTVGLLLYTLLWSLFVMFVDVRSDIVVSEYFVHPRSFHKSNFWLATLSRRIVLVTAYLIIGIYIVLLFRSFPIIFESVSTVFSQGLRSLPSTSFQSILAFASWLLGWHLIVVVRRFSLTLTKEV